MSNVLRSQRKHTLEHERRSAVLQHEQAGWSAVRTSEQPTAIGSAPAAGHSFANLSIFAEPTPSAKSAPGQAPDAPAPLGLNFASLPLFAPAAPTQPLIMRKAQPAPAPPAEDGELLESIPNTDQLTDQVAAAMPALPEGTLDDALAALPVQTSGTASAETAQQATPEPAQAAPADQAASEARSGPGTHDPDYAWRIAQDPGIQPLIEQILARLALYNDLNLRGLTPEQTMRRFILSNRGISNEQLRAMARVPVDNPDNDDADIDDSQADKDETYRKFPHVRETLVHRFTVALFAGITGAPFEQISAAAPTLGVTGVPRRQLGLVQVFWLSDSPYIQLSTALHDFTDTMRGVGVAGINQAVWGSEGQVTSAIQSWLWAQSETVSGLIHQVGETLKSAAGAVADQVRSWVDQAKDWFGRFRRWLGGPRRSEN